MQKYKKTLIMYLVLIALISSAFYFSYKKVSSYRPNDINQEMKVLGDEKAIKDFKKLFSNS